jgi:hypothetical protein
MENDVFQDLPRFEGFFRSQSKGKHPFEEDNYHYNDKRTPEDDRKEQ